MPPKTHLFAVFSDIYSVGRTSLQCWAKPSPVTRLPSERRDANIDRSCVGDIHLDLLSDRDKRPLWKVQGRCSGNRPTVWQTWMKEQTMIEKAVAKCLNMTKLWTLWCMRMASFKMFCCVVHVAKPCSMLCLFSVFIWGRGPTSWFFTGTSAGMGTAAPRRWHGQKVTTVTRYLILGPLLTGREYVSRWRGSCFYESCC